MNDLKDWLTRRMRDCGSLAGWVGVWVGGWLHAEMEQCKGCVSAWGRRRMNERASQDAETQMKSLSVADS
jgi:hypothetical protein